MEEVDSIILHFLRQLDTNIPDDTRGVADLSPETIVAAVSKCLNTVNPALKAPTTLPTGISHRIEVAAQIAAMCKDLGYKSEVGYQTFLYHNEADLRKVFMFLIELLPTEQDKSVVNTVPQDDNSVLWQRIRSKISEEFNSVWVPQCCKPQNAKTAYRYAYNKGDCTDRSNTIQGNLPDEPYIDDMLRKLKEIQILPEKSPSILEEHSVCNKSNQIENGMHQDPADYNVPKADLKELKEEAITLRDKITSLTSEKKVLDSDLMQVRKANETVNADINQLTSIKKLITELGISPEEGLDRIVGKLQADVDRLHAKSDQCTQEILSLKGQIEIIKRDLLQNNSERSRRLNTLEELKMTARELKEEYSNKEQTNIQLRKEYEKLNRSGIKRSFYTKKIMEIIGNVAKQKVEIHKILGDMRQLQKEINSLNGQLDRSFSIADETLFRDAKKDEQSKKAYKLLALLHSECNAIVQLVNDTGTLSREIVDLEDHIEAEKSKRTEDTLKKVQFDLNQIKREIDSLLKSEYV